MESPQTLRQIVRAFHDDEAGFGAIQVVLIIAVAVVALVLAQSRGPTLRTWFRGMTRWRIGNGDWYVE